MFSMIIPFVVVCLQPISPLPRVPVICTFLFTYFSNPIDFFFSLKRIYWLLSSRTRRKKEYSLKVPSKRVFLCTIPTHEACTDPPEALEITTLPLSVSCKGKFSLAIGLKHPTNNTLSTNRKKYFMFTLLLLKRKNRRALKALLSSTFASSKIPSICPISLSEEFLYPASPE